MPAYFSWLLCSALCMLDQLSDTTQHPNDIISDKVKWHCADNRQQQKVTILKVHTRIISQSHIEYGYTLM